MIDVEPEPGAAPEPLTVAEVEPQPVADERPGEAEVTALPTPTPRVHPMARRISDRYDPLAGWQR